LVGGYQGEIVDLSSCSNETVRGICVKAEMLRSQNNVVGKGSVPLYAGKSFGEPILRVCWQKEPIFAMQ